MLETTRGVTCQSWKLERVALVGKRKEKRRKRKVKLKTRKGGLIAKWGFPDWKPKRAVWNDEEWSAHAKNEILLWPSFASSQKGRVRHILRRNWRRWLKSSFNKQPATRWHVLCRVFIKRFFFFVHPVLPRINKNPLFLTNRLPLLQNFVFFQMHRAIYFVAW